MPLLTEVWGSTLGDFMHKGPNQAGNKSLLSYNPALGVPGCTVYTPSRHAVILPIKCGEHTGRPVDEATREEAVQGTMDKVKTSEYMATYRKKPTDTKAFSRSGGGYWITQPLNIESPSFSGKTTYQNEVLDGADTASQQLDKSIGLACTISQYEAARATAPRAQTAGSVAQGSLRSKAVQFGGLLSSSALASTRPATAMTTAGEVVGYQTTNQARFVHNPLTGGAAAPGAPHRSRDTPLDVEMRYQTMPHAMPPGMYGAASACRTDFGEDCSDPMERSAPAERFQTRSCTTRDLSAGTTRNTNNPPGYTGHIAASKYNQLAKAQSAAADERLNRQNDMLLYSLDQFSRSRVPHYTGYKPQAAQNITIVQPSQGPTKATTTGAANLQGTRYKLGPNSSDKNFALNSKTGIMAFFSATGEHVSENGLANAQSFYKLVQPGNCMQHSHLSYVNHHGKPFNPRNSLV